MMNEHLTDWEQKQYGDLIRLKLLVGSVHSSMTIKRHLGAL